MSASVYDKTLVKTSLSPAARTATVNGSSVDRSVAGGSEEAIVVIFTGAIADGSHVVSIQHSEDDSTWFDVPAENLQGALPTIGSADDNQLYEVGVEEFGTFRFLRVRVVVSGAITGGTYGAFVVLGDNRFVPVTH